LKTSGVDDRHLPLFAHVVLLVLIACLISLTPLAHASLPDPMWIAGIYDGADGDDEIASVSWAMFLPLLVPPQLCFVVLEIAPVCPAAACVPRVVSRPISRNRAPPGAEI